MLSESQFRQKVSRLKIVRTLKRSQPWAIVNVDEDGVTIENEGRLRRILFNGNWGLYTNYKILHRDGYLRFGINASGLSISYAIIRDAVPNEALSDSSMGYVSLKLLQ